MRIGVLHRLAILSLLFSGGCKTLSERAFPEPRPAASPTELRGLRIGASVAEIAGVGRLGRHEFSQLHTDGSTYLLSAVEAKFDNDVGVWIYLLFKDGKLHKRLDSVPCSSRYSPCSSDFDEIQGKARRRHDMEDVVAHVIREAEDLGENGLAESLEESRRDVERRKAQPSQIPMPLLCCVRAMSIACPIGTIGQSREMRRNLELYQKFDGHRVVVGSRVETADAMFGQAKARYRLDDHAEMRLYGDDDVGVGDPDIKYSWLAVKSVGGTVTGVYSHIFVIPTLVTHTLQPAGT